MALRSRLGTPAVIGGRAYVERFATSDEFATIFMYELDPESRKAAIEMVVRIAARAKQSLPPTRTPSRDERVKIRWTDEVIAQLRVEAPTSTDDIELAARLGDRTAWFVQPDGDGQRRSMGQQCGSRWGVSWAPAGHRPRLDPPQSGAP